MTLEEASRGQQGQTGPGRALLETMPYRRTEQGWGQGSSQVEEPRRILLRTCAWLPRFGNETQFDSGFAT